MRELDTAEDRPDELTGTSSWGGVAWSADGEWLFYARPDAQMRPYEIWRHRLGTDPTGRRARRRRARRALLPRGVGHPQRAVDRHQLVQQDQFRGPARPGRRPTAEPVLVRAAGRRTSSTASTTGATGSSIVTNLDAPDFRVMTAPLDDPGEWTELVPHVAGRRITDAEPFAGHLVLHEWNDAQPRVRVRFGDGRRARARLRRRAARPRARREPRVGHRHVAGLVPVADHPARVYDHDLVTGERVLRKQTPTPGVDLDRYVSTRTWATAPDGDEGARRRRPPRRHAGRRHGAGPGLRLRLVRGLDARRGSPSPGCRCSTAAASGRWSTRAAAASSAGAGTSTASCSHKRNTFTDTIAAVEHLVAARFAAPGRVAMRGGSAGGLLVGACITMRPELFASAVAEVPFVDVVTTMSDPTLPLTVTEWEEWGDPREEPFASYMLGYSPYDNTVPAEYPALYVTAGLNDPRVSYHEPAKWVAKLRAVRHRPRAPAGDAHRDGRRPRRPERPLRSMARRGPGAGLRVGQHLTVTPSITRLPTGRLPACLDRLDLGTDRAHGRRHRCPDPALARSVPRSGSGAGATGAGGHAQHATTASASRATLRTTWPGPIGRADQAPKHAHGGCSPAASRRTISPVNATRSTDRGQRRDRHRQPGNEHRPERQLHPRHGPCHGAAHAERRSLTSASPDRRRPCSPRRRGTRRRARSRRSSPPRSSARVSVRRARP